MSATLKILCMCVLSRFSHVRLFATLWTIAHEAVLSMGFFKQEYWSGVPFPPPGDLPNPGIEPVFMSPTLAGGFFTTSASWEAHKFCAVPIYIYMCVCVCVCVCVNYIIITHNPIFLLHQ